MKYPTNSQRVAAQVLVSAMKARADVKTFTAAPTLWRDAIALAVLNPKAPTNDIIEAAKELTDG